MEGEINKSYWARRIKIQGIDVILPRPLKIGLDTVLMITGALASYFSGYIIGLAFDNMPNVNETIPNIINYISGIDIRRNVHGFFAATGGLYGMFSSGSYVNRNNLRLENAVISFWPLYRLDCKSEDSVNDTK